MVSNLDNILTIDLEEWFVVEALAGRFARSEWNDLQSTVVRNSLRLLELLQAKRVRATWFVLGWVADHQPDLIRQIAHDGHEIACHSYSHVRVNAMDPDSFRRDTELAVDAIMRAIGRVPVGYRAPSWSIDPGIPWAFEVLAEMGFEYDSSIFPIKHDIYGIPGGPRRPFRMNLDNGRSLFEIPASTYRLWGHNIPVAGGGFLRHSPYWYSRRIIRQLNRREQPAVVYVHPWEIDPEPPRVRGLSPLQRLRTYGSTSLLFYKLDRLFSDFSFVPAIEYIKRQKPKSRRIGFEAE